MLQGKLNIDAGLVTKNDDMTYLTLNVSTIYVLAGYRQFRTNNRASRVICIEILIKLF